MRDLVGQSIRFAAVGLVNTAVGLTAIYALMFIFDAGLAFANVGGYSTGLAVSFALNHTWTFGSRQPINDVLPKYLFAAAVCYFLNLGAVLAAASHFNSNPYLAQLFGVSVYTLSMFAGCRWFVFSHRCPT